MDAKVCDVCGKVIGGEEIYPNPVNDVDSAELTATAIWKNTDKDFCRVCQRKMLAEVGKKLWDQNKQQRKHDKARNTKAD